MHKFSVAHRIFLAVFILLLNGCGGSGNNSGSPNVQVNETSNSTTSYDETIHINNCGGKAESEQTKQRSFSTSIEGGIDVGVQQVVEGIISAKYSQSQNTSVSQKLVAPAGTDMQFILRWQEEVRAGNVIVNGNTGTYTVKIPIAVEQVSSQDLGCGGVPSSGNNSSPTSIVQSTQTSPSSQVLLGLWEWKGNRPPMPAPAGNGQVIFANGDIDNSGTCHVKEFGEGVLVEGLGEGRFQLWLLTGTPEQITGYETIIQQGSASDQNNISGTCSRIP